MRKRGEILVVEDMENWQDLLFNILRDEGYLVRVASTYSEANTLLQEYSPHLAIIDIRLIDADETNVDGLRLLDEIDKKEGATGVIIITGYGVAEHMRAALGKRAVVDFIEKHEFDSQRFKELVRNVIETYC
ncbi:MAG: response regulator [Candidatus Binatia bacterium]